MLQGTRGKHWTHSWTKAVIYRCALDRICNTQVWASLFLSAITEVQGAGKQRQRRNDWIWWTLLSVTFNGGFFELLSLLIHNKSGVSSYSLPGLLGHSAGETQIKCWLWRHPIRNTFLTSWEPYSYLPHENSYVFASSEPPSWKQTFGIRDNSYVAPLLQPLRWFWKTAASFFPPICTPEAADSDRARRRLPKGCFKFWYFPNYCYSS